MKNLKLKIASILILGLSPATVLAQSIPPDPPITKFDDIIKFIGYAGNWLFTIILGLSLVFFMYAAFSYLMSGGDETKIGKAKNIVIYAVVALVVALLAKGVVVLIKNFFGITS